MNVKNGVSLHSIEYLGRDRDFLWNHDFLGLLASRMDLKRCRSVLDVGCGVGHWSLALLPWIGQKPRMVGVDLEPDHALEYERVINLQRGVANARGVTANAERLPFDEGQFDLVTCQTVLMHAKCPEQVLREMMRTLRPGGLLLCVEPNNTVSRMPMAELASGSDPRVVLLLSELAIRISIGLKRRGRSEEYIGERLPALFQSAGAKDIRVWTSDKAFVDLPPYDTPEEVARAAISKQFAVNGTGVFDREEARASFLAADGSEARFKRCWSAFIDAWERAQESRKSNLWSTSNGGLFYIGAGRKSQDGA
jgi:ubiquinone/menaquinone biosynthesis C-methylase UbiE